MRFVGLNMAYNLPLNIKKKKRQKIHAKQKTKKIQQTFDNKSPQNKIEKSQRYKNKIVPKK